MYPGLRERTETDMGRIAERLAERYDLVYPGYVDTLDLADAAGKEFRDRQIDLLIVTESTYCPDYFVHQALTHCRINYRCASMPPSRTERSI